MSSSLSWVDHDQESRDRTLRILSMFSVRDSRDELGIGAIRDSISDALFPGVSTVQTRLRYFLFVPWAFEQVAQNGARGDSFLRQSRELETRLSAVLSRQSDSAGAFGSSAGGQLKTLASRVYWPGLWAWGVRRYGGSIDQFAVDAAPIAKRLRTRLSDDEDSSELQLAWDPTLPAAPANFPEDASFKLRSEEAAYIRDCLARSAGGTLLAYLARVDADGSNYDYPWMHPAVAEASPRHRLVLDQARLFSDLINGASLVYNLELAKLDGRGDRVADYEGRLERWSGAVPLGELSSWNLDALQSIAAEGAYRVTRPTWAFVIEWLDLVLGANGKVLGNAAAAALVRRREETLKKSRSRFLSEDARRQWGGESGAGRLSFRWGTVSRYLADLAGAGDVDA